MDIGISLTALCSISSSLIFAGVVFAMRKGEIGRAYPINLIQAPIRKVDSPKLFMIALVLMTALGAIGILLAVYFSTFIAR